MKKYFLSLLLLIFLVSGYAQKGWRDHEMEVKVKIAAAGEAEKLYNLHLVGDIHSTQGEALMYVVPSELDRIREAGLQYEIMKYDLNAFYKDFWSNKSEQYHSYDDIVALMDSLAGAYPDICRKTLYGLTPQGHQLACLTISKNVNVEENEPEVFFDGGIHGDEIGGPENLIRFARYLCTGYGSDPGITGMIDSREIAIYPMVNPDGRVNMSRYNSNGIDCNRDWGYMWNGEGNSPSAFSQPETRTIRDCIYNHRFVIHMTYHSGEEVVLYPWCYRAAHVPNYNALVQLATIYSDSSGYPALQYRTSYADYPTNGETIDYSYGADGTDALTMEISNSKQPPASQIGYYFMNNVPSMMAMIRNAGYGIGGTVTDSVTGLPVNAAIFINNFFPVYTDTAVGDYHEYLPSGTYSVKVVANNYASKEADSVVVGDQSAAVVNFILKPSPGHYAAKVAAVSIPGNNPLDEAGTPSCLGAPDSINYSLGKNGWIIVDMQSPVFNINGNDLRVHEGDATPEGFTCFAGHSIDGPWTLLGPGNGTTSFDLGAAGVDSIRFIKIVDDGDGVQNAANAGFDLDAVEALLPPEGITNTSMNRNTLSIFPNPAGDRITVETGNKVGNGILIICNSEGLEMMREDMKAGRIILSTRNLASGIYLVKFVGSQGVETGKMIKW